MYQKFERKHWILLLPGLSGFFLFYIYPFCISIYYSLINDVFQKKFVGLVNYKNVLTNDYFQLALKNTLHFMAISIPSIMIFALVIAFIFLKFFSFSPMSHSAFILPVLIPTCSVVLIWKILFCNNEYFSYNLPVFVLFIWKYSGYNILFFIAGLLHIPKELYEACKLESHSWIKIHWHITLPLLTPTILLVFVISIVNSLKVFKEVFLLYGNTPSESMYMLQHYMTNHFYKLNYQNISTASIVLAIIITVFILLVYHIEKHVLKGM